MLTNHRCNHRWPSNYDEPAGRGVTGVDASDGLAESVARSLSIGRDSGLGLSASSSSRSLSAARVGGDDNLDETVPDGADGWEKKVPRGGEKEKKTAAIQRQWWRR